MGVIGYEFMLGRVTNFHHNSLYAFIETLQREDKERYQRLDLCEAGPDQEARDPFRLVP